MLGSGGQADVYKAQWTRSFGAATSIITIAVKRLLTDADVVRDREAMALVLDHKNLVKCLDFTPEPPYLIIMEFCAGGSVFDLLYNSKQELSLCHQTKILSDVATGMRYLHELGILHRDLKSSNVLLTRPIRGLETLPCAKVADFGLARNETGPSLAKMTVRVGTWRWMAPEVFDLLHDGNGQYDIKCDVFSFAILIYEVLVRKLPYCEKYPVDSKDPRIAMHVCLGLRPNLIGCTEHFPDMLTEFMKKAWDPEPHQRPDFVELDEKFSELLASFPETGGLL